ncbi:type II secretion system F family protein [Pseudodesulfovibrio tunisiensis]|uniref:type II secretion system F family protein n=1 Tax=Pseudodesulfovibrio tunisiensis TaxID=463192 RepID=UPI001FB38E77|nr:type II secretion system F family protein [Pseudodesulfovibrio tunisiensis]
MYWIAAAVIGFVVFLLAVGVSALMRSGREERGEKVRARLRTLAMESVDAPGPDVLLRHSALSDVPWFNRFLERMRWAAHVERLIRQSRAKGSAGAYLLACALLGMIGVYVGLVVIGKLFGLIILTFLLARAPIWYLQRKRDRRMLHFARQLPEALDLMARALKAGHTFGGAVRMVADEFDDPIAGEFGQTLDEINFGLDPDRALQNLLDRVDCPDLKFFVVSVNIQRESGGNLAEIVGNIARLVRERFALFGKVKVLSAEGRLSALILSAMPFGITGLLYLINPGYISLLWTTDLGRSMAWGAFWSMCVGIWVIRRMVRIKV